MLDQAWSGWTSRAPARAAKACCPLALRFLKKVGYEDALIVRGYTHVALWFSCFISFAFVAIWFSDIITFQCYAKFPGSKRSSSYLCVYEAIGILVFFASFRDSVRMIAHYDNDRQQVLQQKWQTLDRISNESTQVLQTAKVNVERLREKVVDMMKDHVANYTKEVFTIIMPTLEETMTADNARTLKELSKLLRQNLKEVEDLAVEMLVDLAEENPEVYDRMREQRDSARHPLRLWDAWMSHEHPLCAGDMPVRPASPRGRAASAEADEMEELQLMQLVAKPGKSVQDIGRLARALGGHVLQPVEELLKMPDRLSRLHVEIMGGTHSWRDRGRRAGCGRPPWEGARLVAPCTCCFPRVFAVPLRCVVRCFCCCDCCRARCKKAFTYDPPKRLRLGCFWIQIHTKLHEHLITGLFCSLLYCAFYGYFFFLMIEDFTNNCPEPTTSIDSFRQCVLLTARKCIAALSLLCYMPALAICLYHIDRLDAVMETVETIWELEDIHRAVRAFNLRMEEVADQVVLLRAVQDRVLTRTNLVMRFGKRAGAAARQSLPSAGQSQGQAELWESARCLTERLSQAAEEMCPAAVWLRLPPLERLARTGRARRWLESLNFQVQPVPGSVSAGSGGASAGETLAPEEPEPVPQIPTGPSSGSSSFPEVPKGTFRVPSEAETEEALDTPLVVSRGAS